MHAPQQTMASSRKNFHMWWEMKFLSAEYTALHLNGQICCDQKSFLINYKVVWLLEPVHHLLRRKHTRQMKRSHENPDWTKKEQKYSFVQSSKDLTCKLLDIPPVILSRRCCPLKTIKNEKGLHEWVLKNIQTSL